ncbi:MAG: hypothetical protein ACRDS9_04710 [Pseudonocardiaceae bacterium]
MTTATQERAGDGTYGPKVSPVESAEIGPAYKPAAPRPEVAPEVVESPATLSLLEIATNAVMVPAGAVSMTAATFGTTGLITAATVGLAGGGIYAARNREAIAATAKRAVIERRTTSSTTGQRATGQRAAGRAASRSPRSAGRAAFRAGSLGTSKGARKNAAHRARSAAGATRKGEARKAASNAVRAAAARMAGAPARSGAPKRLGGRPGAPLRVVGGTSSGTARPKAAGRSTGLLKRAGGGGSTKARGGLLKGLKPRGGATGGRVGGRTSLGGSKPTARKTRSTDGAGLGKKRPTVAGLKKRISAGLVRAADRIDNTDTKKAAKRAKRTARRTKWGRFKYVRKATRWLRLRRNALRGLGLITASTAGLATVFKHKDGGPLYRMWQGLHSKTRELLGLSDNAVTARALEAKGRYDAGANTHWRPGTASGAIAGGITNNRNNNTGGNDMTNVNATALESLAEALAVLENYSGQHVGEAGAALTHIGVGETYAQMQQMIAQSLFRVAQHSEQIPHTGPAVAEFLNGSGRGAHSSYEKGKSVAQVLRKRFSIEIERDERGDKSLNVK